MAAQRPLRVRGTCAAACVTWCLAVPLGVLAAVHREARAWDRDEIPLSSTLTQSGGMVATKLDAAQAEREFKAAAEIAPVGSPARMRLADFYLLARKPDEAKRILSEITQKAPEYLPAWRRRC